MTPELVIIGPLLIDAFVTQDHRNGHIQAGGSLLYAALAASLFSSRVAVVGHCGQDYPIDALEQLQQRGVWLNALNRCIPHSGRCVLEENETGQRRFLYPREYPSLRRSSPDPSLIPKTYLQAKYFLITPFYHAKQIAIINTIRQHNEEAIIGLDPYNLIPKGILSPFLEGIQKVDFFLPSEAELNTLSTHHNHSADFFVQLQSLPKQALLVKHGHKGVKLYQDTTTMHCDAFRHNHSIDNSGAGDSFCGSLFGALATGFPLSKAIALACSLASFTVEKEGARALYPLQYNDVHQRAATLHFHGIEGE
jgi:sugar/nucleoside kinase (ribokinase family)